MSILNPGIPIFPENLQKPRENGRFLNRTMIEHVEKESNPGTTWVPTPKKAAPYLWVVPTWPTCSPFSLIHVNPIRINQLLCVLSLLCLLLCFLLSGLGRGCFVLRLKKGFRLKRSVPRLKQKVALSRGQAQRLLPHGVPGWRRPLLRHPRHWRRSPRSDARAARFPPPL